MKHRHIRRMIEEYNNKNKAIEDELDEILRIINDNDLEEVIHDKPKAVVKIDEPVANKLITKEQAIKNILKIRDQSLNNGSSDRTKRHNPR